MESGTSHGIVESAVFVIEPIIFKKPWSQAEFGRKRTWVPVDREGASPYYVHVAKSALKLRRVV
jgi:hypothetical protein